MEIKKYLFVFLLIVTCFSIRAPAQGYLSYEYCGSMILSIVKRHEQKATSSIEKTREVFANFKNFRRSVLNKTDNSVWNFDEVVTNSAEAKKEDIQRVALRVRGLEKTHETFSFDQNTKNQTFGVVIKGEAEIKAYLDAVKKIADYLKKLRTSQLLRAAEYGKVSHLLWGSASFLSAWPGMMDLLSGRFFSPELSALSIVSGIAFMVPVFKDTIHKTLTLKAIEDFYERSISTLNSAMLSKQAQANKEHVWVYLSKNLKLPENFFSLLKENEYELWKEIVRTSFYGELHPSHATLENGFADLLFDQFFHYTLNSQTGQREPTLNIYIRFKTPQPEPPKKNNQKYDYSEEGELQLNPIRY